MEKELVIERLDKTIERLQHIPDENFSYECFVKEHERIDGTICGTVCCVAGWYPQWFPESNLAYAYAEENSFIHGNKITLINLDIGYSVILSSLSIYHGLSGRLIQFLFYGKEYEFSGDSANKICGVLNRQPLCLSYSEQTSSNRRRMRLTSGTDSSRFEVLCAFKAVREMVDRDLLDDENYQRH